MKTLVIAHDNEGDSMTPVSVFLFLVEHVKTVEPATAIRAAFRQWAETPEGKEYIEGNGTNWGDAFAIPGEILSEHGVSGYQHLKDHLSFLGACLRKEADNGDSMGAGMTADELETPWENEIIVDHNEDLVS